MHVLCVSPVFVPSVNAEAFVSAKMVMALVEAGHDVTVIREPASVDPNLPEDASTLWQTLRDRTVDVDAPDNVRVLATLWLGLRYRSWRIYPRWIHRAVSTARGLHRERPVDVVYSRSLPMRAHIAGYWCARALGVPWVVSINDPWDLHLFPVVVGRRRAMMKRLVSDYWLRKTLRRADAVTFPCRRLAEYHVRVSGVTRDYTVIPHIGLAREPAAREDGFHLVHAGSLGPNVLTTGRPSTGLLNGLRLFFERRVDARARTTLTLIGPEDPATVAATREAALDDVVVSTGQLSFEDALTRIAAADVCVLVEEDMPEGIYLPSKLADYVAAGKPVLALSPREGTVADLMPDAGLLRADVDDANAIAERIDELYEAASADRLDAHRPSEELRTFFSPAGVLSRFAAALDDADIEPFDKLTVPSETEGVDV